MSMNLKVYKVDAKCTTYNKVCVNSFIPVVPRVIDKLWLYHLMLKDFNVLLEPSGSNNVPASTTDSSSSPSSSSVNGENKKESLHQDILFFDPPWYTNFRVLFHRPRIPTLIPMAHASSIRGGNNYKGKDMVPLFLGKTNIWTIVTVSYSFSGPLSMPSCPLHVASIVGTCTSIIKVNGVKGTC
jgi:hypothetical protein